MTEVACRSPKEANRVEAGCVHYAQYGGFHETLSVVAASAQG
jgi:hypothetical protein